MYIEVCVNWSNNIEKCIELIKTSYRLGYSGIAFNHSVNLSEKCNNLKSNKKQVSNLLTLLVKEGHYCPIQYIYLNPNELSSTGIHNKRFFPKNQFVSLNLSCHNININKKYQSEDDISSEFLQLRRLTIIFDNNDVIPYINALCKGSCNEATDGWSKTLFSDIYQQNYDLIALRPTTQATFISAISSSDCDIISLDLCSNPRLPFVMRRAQLNLAISRGIFFEIDVGPALSNTNYRKNLCCNLLNFARYIPTKHILITSSSSNIMDLRGPLDLSNLASTLLSMDLDRKPIMNPSDFLVDNVIRALLKGTNRKTYASVLLLEPNN
ncbi:RNase P subunit p30 family protein [Cryptosporidium muris RN66]|uniref:RNase P subunit p30 family protein n=1 Tax=Cryptosporidium muris (strain RN66) TaxID=441375 RepID=B6AAL3_CRYMR|nr:RNase P subunit p30 family protein [Cryptosporidium muris RN66]EEA05254.1 RNase P subunit p30 family protein [Cryptosporidium muris RN66]|eukprot:XP_002139603.1 RNase P subunit p30 family protein [Cryptosporidium muris RN66]